MLDFLLHRVHRPADAEERCFETFAAEVRGVATELGRSARFVASSGAALELQSARDAEFALLAVEIAAKDHLNRHEDLLVLLQRVAAMIDANPRRVEPPGRIDAGLHLLRAIAMAELLVHEATTRFRNDARCLPRANEAMSRLAAGARIRLGAELPPNLERAFPLFAAAVARAARPAASVTRSNHPRSASTLPA